MSREKYKLQESDILSGKLRLPEKYAFPKHDHANDTFTSIRTANHAGKEIRVETTYRITIDGKPVTSHISVGDDGTVHTHGFPNYSFRSALDMAKRLAGSADVELPANELGGTH